MNRMHLLRAVSIIIAIVAMMAGMEARGGMPDEYISLPDVLLKRSDGRSPILVDVRPSDQYEQAHIPDSLNIPIYALKTKSFLRYRDVVLVDAGWDDPRLELVCQSLRGADITSIQILRGGIAAWSHAGMPLEGQNTTIQKCDMIKPGEALVLARDRVRVMLWVDCHRDAPPGWGWSTQAVSFATSIIKESGNDSSILICSDSETNIESMRAARDARSGPEVFFIEGGSSALYDVLSLSMTQSSAIIVSTSTIINSDKNGNPPCLDCPLR